MYHYIVICAKILPRENNKLLFYGLKVSYLFSRARIPVASQVTALEIWLLACILLVFGALAEYAFILRQVIKLSRQQQRMRNHFNLQLKNSDGNNPHSPPQQLDVFSPNAGMEGITWIKYMWCFQMQISYFMFILFKCFILKGNKQVIMVIVFKL